MKLQAANSDLVVAAMDDATSQSSTQDRSAEFQAVQGGPETTSGEVLLVEAYAAVWLVVFVFVFVSWRRQTRLDARMGELEKRLAEHQG